MELKSDSPDLLIKIERFVSTFFKNNKNKKILFHTLAETRKRVQMCKQILKQEQLTTKDALIVKCAAWFCTTGYVLAAHYPVNESATIARKFLVKAGCKPHEIQKISDLIIATESKSPPANKLQGILGDALHHDDGSAGYFANQKLLRKELELSSGVKIARLDWWKQQLSELSAYEYQTVMYRSERNAQRLINIDRLKEKILDMTISHPRNKPFNNRKRDLPERGVETMVKISSSTNQRLSSMADGDDNGFLFLPALILLCVCLVTMILLIIFT